MAKTMNLQKIWQQAPITLILILSFVLLMLYQLMNGVQIDNPSPQVLLRFGANFLPLSMTDEAWRLLSAGFLHIGLMHLLFNSFAMYYFGQVTEIIFGRLAFLVVFVLSVIGGNLASNAWAWWRFINGDNLGISAGASGGLMGLGAALLVMASLRADMGLMLNRRNLFWVMLINLSMGFAVEGIDNAGHLGGAFVGALFGAVYAWQKAVRTVYFWVASALIALGLGAIWWLLHLQILGTIG